MADEDTLIINPSWLDPALFAGFRILAVDPDEPFAANVLRIGSRVLCASEHPRTRALLESNGITTASVEAGELAKAEGGLTCGSVLVKTRC